MEEFNLQIKVRNNLILERVRKLGFDSLMPFCKKYEISYPCVSKLINLRQSATNKNGSISNTVLRLAEIFKVMPEDLFTQKQMTEHWATNVAEKAVSQDDMYLLERQDPEMQLLEFQDTVEHEQRRRDVEVVLATLTPREQRVLKKKFGFEGEEMSTEEIAQTAGENGARVSGMRVRQIEEKALRKLKQTSRYNVIKQYKEGLE